MPSEVERKWLVEAGPSELPEGDRLRQGYLAVDGDVEVRLRLTATRNVVTIKSGSGLSRTEVELACPTEAAEELWRCTEGRRIEKVRYRLPVPGDLTAELDVYEGALDGLRTVEVEFADEAAASAFSPPPWFGRELTGEPGWTNAQLAEHGRPA